MLTVAGADLTDPLRIRIPCPRGSSAAVAAAGDTGRNELVDVGAEATTKVEKASLSTKLEG